MQFAVILLIILAAACTAGSLITQGQTYAWYAQNYSERTAALILTLHLDDAFHSWWFIVISAFLCLNLLFCNIVRFPKIRAAAKGASNPQTLLNSGSAQHASGLPGSEKMSSLLGFRSLKEIPLPEGKTGLFGVKNTAGYFSAWVCHFGILLLIAGFALGQATKQEYTVYGIPGQDREIGETGLVLTIDDFSVDLREDDTVSQYTTSFTIHDTSSGRVFSGETGVNHPASFGGWRIYQNSTGYAAAVRVLENGEPLQEAVLCTGESLAVADKPELVIFFNAFYPDYEFVAGQGPSTRSGQMENPAYLYTVYFNGQILGMNVLENGDVLTIDEYTVYFEEPRNFTLLQVKKDRFAPLAFAGGIAVMLGLILAFYCFPERLLLIKEKDGTFTAIGECRKGGSLFAERFAKAAEEAGGKVREEQ